jgi:Domain of unknown function (DUF4258)
MNCTSTTYSAHAIKRMFQRSLTVADVDAVVRTGLVIEDYPTDFPYPSCLLLGWTGATPVHAVVGRNPSTGECIVVTVYVPDPARWSPDFKTRTTP